MLIADSSCDPSGKNKPQHGWLLQTLDSMLVLTPLISLRSKGLRRKAGSTTLCERISLSTKNKWQYSNFDPKKFMDDVEVSICV